MSTQMEKEHDGLDSLVGQVESVHVSVDGDDTTVVEDDSSSPANNKPQCCICQEKCVNPVQLQCRHVFCYLCIKGAAARSNHCALCRHRIPPRFLDNPSPVNREELKSRLEDSTDMHKWYYEARHGGWWLYEHRTSAEIEKAFNEQKGSVRLQISGFYYIIDLKNNVQYREDIPGRRRKIKRDSVNNESVKGVAGLSVQTLSEHSSGHIDDDDEQFSNTSRRSDEDEGSHNQSTYESGQGQSRLVTGLD